MPDRRVAAVRRSRYDGEILRLALPALGALAAEPAYLLADTAIVGHLGTPQLAALALAAIVLGGVVGLSIFLTYGTTAHVSRSARRGPPRGGRGARGAGAVAGAGAGRGDRARRRGRRARPHGRAGRPRRGRAPGDALPAHRRARRADGADRARRPGLAARRGRPADAAGHRHRGQRRERRAGGACSCTASGPGPGRLGRRHGHRAARDGRWRSPRCCCARRRPRGRRTSRGSARWRRSAPCCSCAAPRCYACFTLATAVCARIGAPSLGAHQIAFQLFNSLALVLDAIAIAGQVIVGPRAGRRRRGRARSRPRGACSSGRSSPACSSRACCSRWRT